MKIHILWNFPRLISVLLQDLGAKYKLPWKVPGLPSSVSNDGVGDGDNESLGREKCATLSLLTFLISLMNILVLNRDSDEAC